MMKESDSAGPAVTAPVPVNTKIPVPTMAPMPISTRSKGPRTFLSPPGLLLAAIMASRFLVLKILTHTPIRKGAVGQMIKQQDAWLGAVVQDECCKFTQLIFFALQ